MPPHYDCIVIGAGHNGLVTAAYLAKAGRKVLVLERRDVVGGACVTEEAWPGCKVSTAAYVNSLFRPEIVRDLDLPRHGFQMLPRDPSSFTPFPDGRSLLMGPDAELTRREVSRFSKRDAEALPLYEAMIDRLARALDPVIDGELPDPFAGSPADRDRTAALLGRLGELGPDLPHGLDVLTGSATALLERWFESEEVKVTLATDGVIGVFAPPSAPGTAYTLFHHVMGEGGGKRGVWGYVRGGMGSLTQALASAARGHGADIRTGEEVARILVKDGQVAGVALADGTEFRADRVASNATAHVTFLKLTDPRDLPAEFVDGVRHIDYASASLKINALLSELPSFTARPGRPAPQHRGTVHVCPSLDAMERAYDDAKFGRPSETPMLEIGFPTAVDDTLAPPGRHIMSMFVQYAPYHLREGNWDALKDRFADRCFAVLEEYAPGFSRSVIERQVLSPVDIERRFNLTGGNIFQGAMSPRHVLFLRPGYRTPVRGLYLCGSAAHPGGGVMGASGRNAARVILRDLGGEK
jgi:phytoene dehydrogenase-like protein